MVSNVGPDVFHRNPRRLVYKSLHDQLNDSALLGLHLFPVPILVHNLIGCLNCDLRCDRFCCSMPMWRHQFSLFRMTPKWTSFQLRNALHFTWLLTKLIQALETKARALRITSLPLPPDIMSIRNRTNSITYRGMDLVLLFASLGGEGKGVEVMTRLSGWKDHLFKPLRRREADREETW